MEFQFISKNAPSVVKIILNLFMSSVLEYRVQIMPLITACGLYQRSTGTISMVERVLSNHLNIG